MEYSILQYQFMQHAILAGICGGITCAIIGVFVVTMHLSFIGVCIAHAAFAGALCAMLLGFDPLIGALLFSIISAVAIGPMADKGELNLDTSIGIVFSLMLGLAFLFIGLMSGSRTDAINLFWGTILTITKQDLALLISVTCITLATVILFYKEIQAVICHRNIAMAVGISATFIFYALLILTGLTITASMRSIGGLLVYTLIINPAAAAYQLTYNLRLMFVIAAIFGIISTMIGLAASYYFNLPSGAAIVITSSLIFAISMWVSPKRKILKLQKSGEDYAGAK